MKIVSSILVVFILSFQAIYGQCIRTAPFVDGPEYSLNGTATLNFLLDGTKTLDFSSNFSTDSGPDLHVYLSNSETVSTPVNGELVTEGAIDLGLLKSSSGSQSYDLSGISPVVDIDGYAYVVIHCAEFNHYWGTGTFGVKSGADCANLSAEGTTQTQFKVYPTKVENQVFYIENNGAEQPFVNIMSILGEVVQESVLLTEVRTSIDTSTLKSGIYMVQIVFENRMETYQIVIP